MTLRIFCQLTHRWSVKSNWSMYSCGLPTTGEGWDPISWFNTLHMFVPLKPIPGFPICHTCMSCLFFVINDLRWFLVLLMSNHSWHLLWLEMWHQTNQHVWFDMYSLETTSSCCLWAGFFFMEKHCLMKNELSLRLCCTIHTLNH
jgi:hypothetical protein